MGKHTPGPWAVEFNWKMVATVAGGANGYELFDVRGDVPDFQKNARLIAAAPELLEALEELLSIGSVFISAIEANDPSVDFENWEAKARAAIAKARGEA
jgi:hypothetical protein